MRLKLLTNLNTLLLVAVCVALGATLWWSQKALERPYLLMERYLGLSQQFQNDVARSIEDYLGSGDALRLSSAAQGIDSLQKELGELPPALAEALRPSLSTLEEFSKTDLLAAGKLAGDPQALLLQAERELGASLDQLSQYASGNAAYLTPLLTASQHLGKLSLTRDKLVSSGRSELAADVEREVANIRIQAEKLDALPLLGVTTSSESNTDDFASMMGLENKETTVAEDAGVGLKRELNSLLIRYPAELSRTRDQIRKRADLSAATHLKIADVQQAIAGMEPVVRAQHGQIQGEVRLMQGVMIGLILLIALLIDTLQRKLARTLTNLAPALSTWAEGDFSRDIQLGNTNRELHDIEASLNRLRAYLVDLVGTIRRNAEQVAGSSRTLADLSNDLHDGAEHQAGDTALIRDSLSELEATIQQVAGALLRSAAPQDFSQVAIGETHALLQKARASAAAAGVPCEMAAKVCDRPAQAIVETAGASGCDLIVMASHGLRGLPGWLRKSHTEQVLRQSPVPLLVTRVESSHPLSDRERALAVILDEHRSIACVIRGMQELVSESRESKVASGLCSA